MTRRRRTGLGTSAALLCLALALVCAGPLTAAGPLQPPEQFTGFTVGTERKLVRWDQILEYMKLADAASDRVRVRELGRTSGGNPFVAVEISAAETLQHALAAQLGVGVGDSVSVLTAQGTLSPMGMMPRARRMRVAGIFSLGLYEFDSTYGFVSLDAARRLLDKDRVDLIQLRVSDMDEAPQIAAAVERLGPEYLTEDWVDMNRSLFSALWIEKIAISLTIGLIVMVAALNIIASLILLVMEKHRDIAILKTMGASAGSVTAVFMMQGLIIGIVGTLVGASAGFGLSYLADRYRWIRVPMDVYQVAHVPFTVEPFDFVLVIISAIIVCFLATIYPSRQAARLDPAQALRYE